MFNNLYEKKLYVFRLLQASGLRAEKNNISLKESRLCFIL